MRRFCLIASLAVAATLFTVGLTLADVTAVGYYRLGDVDPGAVAGNPGNPTTTDSSSAGMNLTYWTGTQNYSSSVAASAAARTGSGLSMDFAGNGFYLTQASCLTGATDNFGIEGWFNVDYLAQMGLCCNGDGLSGYGFGLYVIDANADGIYTAQGYYCGRNLFDTGFAPTAGQWFYMAMVRDNGVTKMYVNNTDEMVVSTTAEPGSAAYTPQFSLGIVSYDPFVGMADEVRVFTFEPGAFSASRDLLIAVPEPSTLALAAFGLVGLVACVWRKRK
jgi:hypothetical protein